MPASPSVACAGQTEGKTNVEKAKQNKWLFFSFAFMSSFAVHLASVGASFSLSPGLFLVSYFLDVPQDMQIWFSYETKECEANPASLAGRLTTKPAEQNMLRELCEIQRNASYPFRTLLAVCTDKDGISTLEIKPPLFRRSRPLSLISDSNSCR